MQDQIKKISIISGELDSSYRELDIDKKLAELEGLNKELEDPHVWDNSENAQKLSKKQAKLKLMVEPWVMLKQKIDEASQLARMDDDSLLNEISKQIEEASKSLAELKKSLKYSGPYDDHDAVIKLQAGAGGVDAMDWTAMLERMYLRWAEKAGYKAELVDESKGEEAGIKSATITISGINAFGKLQSEHGVHRLVRLSPFNSDNLRQTSFAMVEVLPQIDEPDEVEVDDKDIRVDVFRASGHGGQSVNTTDSAVRIKHIPTNIVVSIQNEKSQIQNKETAMKILRSKLAQLQVEQHAERISELKGPNLEAAWGNQIRNYVLHPYSLVKNTKTKFEVKDAQKVLDGDLDAFLN